MMLKRQCRIWGSALVAFVAVHGSGCKSGPTAMDYVVDAQKSVEKDRLGEASTFLDLAVQEGAPQRQVRKLRSRIARNRALRALESGRDREAFETFLDAAETDPRRRSSCQTFLKALEIGRRLGMRPEKLASVAQHAVDADPSSVRARRNAGQLWEAAGKPERAIRSYLWIWQSDRSFTNIGGRLAAVYDQLGRTDDAVAILRQILNEDPEDTQAAIKLAGLYADTDRSQRARELYERLVERHPNNAGILLRYARFLRDRGDRNRAETLEKRAYEQMPGRKERKMRELR